MSSGTPVPLLRVVPETGFAPRSAAETRPIVMVLGMHRSGTSLCSHVLSALGVDMADRLTHPSLDGPAPDNAKGHWERWEIVQVHERILKLFDRDYRSGFHDFPLPVAWWADPRVGELRRELAAFLKGRLTDGVFGFKDPRTVRLLPIWFQILNELKLTPKIVYCLRNPAQVARSLHARDGLRLELGEYRWLSYNIDFFHHIRDLEYCTIEYETWFNEPKENIAKLRGILGLPERQDASEMDLGIAEIVDEQLRHDDLHHQEARQPLLRSVYDTARRAGDERAARAQLQIIAAQFRTFLQLQRAFEREFEERSRLAARVPALEGEIVRLHASIVERDGQIEALQAEAPQRASRLDDTLAALEKERGRVADLLRERQQDAAALDAANSSLSLRDARIAEIEAVLAEQTAAIKASQAEMAGQREALELARQKDRESRNSQTTLEAAHAKGVAVAETLQREVDRLQSKLRGIGDAVKSLETELDRLPAVLSGAEQEVPHASHGDAENTVARLRRKIIQLVEENKNRAATARLLESELNLLKVALSDSREIAQHAIQALARPICAVVHREPPLGWRQLVRRLLGTIRSI
jgi:hypothetical protein